MTASTRTKPRTEESSCYHGPGRAMSNRRAVAQRHGGKHRRRAAVPSQERPTATSRVVPPCQLPEVQTAFGFGYWSQGVHFGFAVHYGIACTCVPYMCRCRPRRASSLAMHVGRRRCTSINRDRTYMSRQVHKMLCTLVCFDFTVYTRLRFTGYAAVLFSFRVSPSVH